MPHHLWNCSQAGALVAAVLQGDPEGLGKALSSDKIVEPKRAPLIPGMEAVKKVGVQAGGYGCTISGAGPTAVTVVDDEKKGKVIGEKMVEAFWKEGNLKAVAIWIELVLGLLVVCPDEVFDSALSSVSDFWVLICYRKFLTISI